MFWAGFTSITVTNVLGRFYFKKSNQCELGLKWDDWYYNEANNKNAMVRIR